MDAETAAKFEEIESRLAHIEDHIDGTVDRATCEVCTRKWMYGR